MVTSFFLRYTLYTNFTKQCSNVLQVWWKSLRCIHREFSYASFGEKNLKIGPHLPKLLSNIMEYTFLRQSVVRMRCHSNHWMANRVADAGSVFITGTAPECLPYSWLCVCDRRDGHGAV